MVDSEERREGFENNEQNNEGDQNLSKEQEASSQENRERRSQSRKKFFSNSLVKLVILLLAILNDILDAIGVGQVPVLMDIYDAVSALLENRFDLRKSFIVFLVELIPFLEFFPTHTIAALMNFMHTSKIKEKHKHKLSYGISAILITIFSYITFKDLIVVVIIFLLFSFGFLVFSRRKINVMSLAFLVAFLFLLYLYYPFLLTLTNPSNLEVTQEKARVQLPNLFESFKNFFDFTRAQNENVAAGTDYKRRVNYYSRANIGVEYKSIISSTGDTYTSTYFKDEDLPIEYSVELAVDEFGFQNSIDVKSYCEVYDSSRNLIKKSDENQIKLNPYNRGLSYTCSIGYPRDFDVGFYTVEFHTLFDHETWAYLEVPFITQDYYLDLMRTYSSVSSIENKYQTVTVYTKSPLSVGIGVPGKSGDPITQVLYVENNVLQNPLNYIGVNFMLSSPSEEKSIKTVKELLVFVPKPFEINNNRCGSYPVDIVTNSNEVNQLMNRVTGLKELVEAEDMIIYRVQVPERVLENRWYLNLICNLKLREGTTLEDFFPNPYLKDTAKTFLTYINFEYDLKEKRYFEIKESTLR